MLPGAAMGVAARMIFVTFQMVAAAFVGTKFLSPLGMAGAALLGRVPLEQSFPLEFAALAVLLFYVVVSAACGAIFGTLSAVGPIRQSRWALLVAAMVFVPCSGWSTSHWSPREHPCGSLQQAQWFIS